MPNITPNNTDNTCSPAPKQNTANNTGISQILVSVHISLVPNVKRLTFNLDYVSNITPSYAKVLLFQLKSVLCFLVLRNLSYLETIDR